MNDDYVRLAGVVEDSTVDGPGMRYVIFTQGCPHHCVGCHNPGTHDTSKGTLVSIDKLVENIKKNPLISGITLSGGEPFLQAEKMCKIIDKLGENNYDIMAYTGFKYEQLLEKSNDQNKFKELLGKIDFLVDGKFELEKKNELLMFRGSSNQRIIDCRNSLRNQEVLEAIVHDDGEILYND